MRSEHSVNSHEAGCTGMSALHAVVAMAAALNNADADGRIIIDPSGPSLKFILLNAAAHFAKVCLSFYAIMN